MEKQHVLVIDSSREVQQILAELVLDPSEHDTIEALDGDEGIRLARQESPELIILNLQLPQTNGLAVLEELRQVCPDTPVILTTDQDAIGPALRGFRLGAQRVVPKPFEIDGLRETVHQFVPPSDLRQEGDRFVQQLVDTNRRLRRQLHQLDAIHTVGRRIASSLDLSSVLKRALEAAVNVVNAEEGVLLLLDDEGGLHLRAAVNVDASLAHSLPVRVDAGIVKQVSQTGLPVLLADGGTEVLDGYDVMTLLCLPLRTPVDGVIGVLGVMNRDSSGPFSVRDIELLSALGDYVAIGIENARQLAIVERQESELEAVLKQAQEPIIVVDEDYDVLLCNASACSAFGLAQPNPLYKSVDEVVSRSALRDLFSWARETGQAMRSEVVLADGRTFNAQVTPVEAVGWVVVMQDISHLKELDRLKSESVGTVSHDLRTPLTNIIGYVELMPRVGPLNAQQEDFIRRVRDGAQAVTDMIGNLLEIARIDAGLDLEMTVCRLQQVAEEAIYDFLPRAKRKSQELYWEAGSPLPLVDGNPRRLRQVMDNLLSNAIYYTQEGGTISVTAVEENGHIVMNVADNGPGIPIEEQPYVFDRFYRLEREETSDVEGAGLGLAIVRAVVERHDGRVWVTSRPGAGSVFSFILPVSGK